MLHTRQNSYLRRAWQQSGLRALSCKSTVTNSPHRGCSQMQYFTLKPNWIGQLTLFVQLAGHLNKTPRPINMTDADPVHCFGIQICSICSIVHFEWIPSDDQWDKISAEIFSHSWRGQSVGYRRDDTQADSEIGPQVLVYQKLSTD